MADKKKLRASLSATETLFMALMPASQAVAIHALHAVWSGERELLPVVTAMSTFYALWAIKNRLTTIKAEKGHYPLIMTLIGCVYAQRGGGASLALLGALGVLLAFLLAATRVLRWPASKLAYVSKKTLGWAMVMKLYYVSSIASWGAVAYMLYRER